MDSKYTPGEGHIVDEITNRFLEKVRVRIRVRVRPGLTLILTLALALSLPLILTRSARTRRCCATCTSSR